MPLDALAIPLPINFQTLPDHPALNFYALYAQKFPKTPEQWTTADYEDFYSKDCKIYRVDGSLIDGGEEGWRGFRKLYESFPGIEREMRSLIVVSDEEKGTHEIHVEFITKLPGKGGVVELPQAFVYTLGKADEGKGLGGLQIRGLRNYYDLRTWEGALGELK